MAQIEYVLLKISRKFMRGQDNYLSAKNAEKYMPLKKLQ